VDPADEDIHMAIERRLIELIGPVGGKLHTARSRNDQVATDVALFVRAHTLEAKDNLAALMKVLVERAEEHLDWRMPAYTQLQGALHGLPLDDDKQQQEDKEPLFAAVETLELTLSVGREMLRTVRFTREGMAGAACDEFLGATDVADLLVGRGVPFRGSHGM